MAERRAHERHGIWFPVSVEVQQGERPRQLWAVCRDIGSGGILLSSSGGIEVGATVTLTFRSGPDDPVERRVEGRIVRIEAHQGDGGGTWPHRLGVAFAQPIPELDALLERWTLPSQSGPPPAS
jgi:PilZ domain